MRPSERAQLDLIDRRGFLRTLSLTVPAVAIAMQAGPRPALGQAWTPPIGIPAPSFGIAEVAPAAPNPWTSAINGFYYVDSTSGASTDTSNPNGWPGKPRRTVPTSIPAGAYVEVRGGPYTISTAGQGITWTFGGTPSQPCFIHGVGVPVFQGSGTNAIDFTVSGSYYIIEGVALKNFQTHLVMAGDHGAIRNCDVTNPVNLGQRQFGAAIFPGGNNMVIYANHIHDIGDWRVSAAENDFHGVKSSTGSHHVWVVDNEIDHMGGNGTQFGDDVASEPWAHHIYIGRNNIHHTRKSSLDVKETRDVIQSQNELWEAHWTSDHTSGGIAIKRCCVNCWNLFNRIHDIDQGAHFTDSNDSGIGRFATGYFIGNLMYNIAQASNLPNNPGNSGGYAEAAGFIAYNIGEGRGVGNSTVAFVNNTIFNARHGMAYGAGGGPNTILFANNIVHLSHPTHHLANSLTAAQNAQARNNLFDPTGVSQSRIYWKGDGTLRNVTSFQSAYSADASANIEAVAQFVSAPTNLQVTTASRARDAGLTDPGGLCALFLNTYDLSITVDFARSPRPASGWDIGAFEIATGGPVIIPSPPTNPTLR